MSADRRTACPRCVARRAAQLVEQAAAATEAYGKVSSQEYSKLCSDLVLTQQERIPETFAEYREIGVRGAELVIGYSGSCDVCGLKKEYSHREPVDLDG